VVLLAVLGTPIVAVSFHHGAYNLTDVVNAVAGLDFYLPGLWFVAIDQMLIFAFYAKNDTLTPVVVNLVSIAGYCLAALLGLDVFHLSFRGLAMADSVKQVIHAVTLFVLLWRWQGGLSGFGLGRLAGKVAVAAIVSAVVCMLALHHYHDGMQGLKLVAFTVVACSAGLAAYFGTLLALRTEEMQIIVNRLQTRLGRTA
jgi:putative peptidoglycan lipid II flippase